MPRRQKKPARHNLLQQYELQSRSCFRLHARSENHDRAHIRVLQQDVQALQTNPHTISKQIVALFTTCHASEPVSLRSTEMLHLCLPHKSKQQEHWVTLRLVAHHAYVEGMRVSGIVHRAIVRLEIT